MGLINALPSIGISVSVLIHLDVLGTVGAMYELMKNRTQQVK